MSKLVGTWELVTWEQWEYTAEGSSRKHPFGQDASGQMIYTPEGTVMTILQKKKRSNFEKPCLGLGSPEEKCSAIDGYVSYSGTYQTHGKIIVHKITSSLLPNWIGTDLVREISWCSDNSMVLSTRPVQTCSGKLKVELLHWKKFDPDH
uniref:Lipocalin-like domain-containing protein n=1 Tax=Trieres chinensis TaxID=1514140 RepID=A0A6U1XEK2_TRICV|mmetsp:Transcript_33571/g.68551  ORF Transcript_33571/g.68551 Transcript_33571/m.68551 type:complete len:149 (+) Transcript_33571:223-669(+)